MANPGMDNGNYLMGSPQTPGQLAQEKFHQADAAYQAQAYAQSYQHQQVALGYAVANQQMSQQLYGQLAADILNSEEIMANPPDPATIVPSFSLDELIEAKQFISDMEKPKE